LEDLRKETWYRAETKVGFERSLILRNKEGSVFVKVNPVELTEQNQRFRLEVLDRRDGKKFYSFGNINDLSSVVNSMDDGFCWDCHRKAKNNGSFSDRYLLTWTTEPKKISFVVEGGRIRLREDR
jgi:hypothetical protein